MDSDPLQIQPDASDTQVTDGVTLALNGVEWEVGNLPRLKKRPNASDKKAKWISYAVSLGADRNFLMSSEYTKEALSDLCDRLGG